MNPVEISSMVTDPAATVLMNSNAVTNGTGRIPGSPDGAAQGAATFPAITIPVIAATGDPTRGMGLPLPADHLPKTGPATAVTTVTLRDPEEGAASAAEAATAITAITTATTAAGIKEPGQAAAAACLLP
jgi:hypothetical protein